MPVPNRIEASLTTKEHSGSSLTDSRYSYKNNFSQLILTSLLNRLDVELIKEIVMENEVEVTWIFDGDGSEEGGMTTTLDELGTKMKEVNDAFPELKTFQVKMV